MSTNEEIEVFCENIKYLRRKYGLSRTKMAKIMHISISWLDLIERGILPQRLKAVVLIAA